MTDPGLIGDLARTVPVIAFMFGLIIWLQRIIDALTKTNDTLRAANDDLHERMLRQQSELNTAMLAQHARLSEEMLKQNTDAIPVLREAVSVLKEISVLVETSRRSDYRGRGDG